MGALLQPLLRASERLSDAGGTANSHEAHGLGIMSNENRSNKSTAPGEPGDDFPPLMTTPQAARYCGYKTTSALRQAQAAGRVRSSRRYGTKRHTWKKEDLDRFMLGLPPSATVVAGRSSAPLSTGGTHEREAVETTVEEYDQAKQAPRSLGKEGGRIPRSGKGAGPDHRQDAGGQAGVARRRRERRVHVAARDRKS